MILESTLNYGECIRIFSLQDPIQTLEGRTRRNRDGPKKVLEGESPLVKEESPAIGHFIYYKGNGLPYTMPCVIFNP